MASSLRVEATGLLRRQVAKERPAHWANDEGTAFKNPWPSFREHDWHDQYYVVFQWKNRIPKVPENIASLLPVKKPTWGLDRASVPSDDLKITWLGHASILLEMPARTSLQGVDASSKPPSRGIRILFDPIFSERCSPVQYAGPKRITPSPCQVSDLPEIDAVVISHDHFDHMDANTLRALLKRPRTPHIFAPAGNAKTLKSMGVPDSHCHILDWWESRRLSLDLNEAKSGSVASSSNQSSKSSLTVDLTCTPAQHNSGRAFTDRFFDLRTLWSSWAVEEVFVDGAKSEKDTTSRVVGRKAYFAGDTGYRAVLDGQDEATLPTCPAFKEIGQRFGGFDVALLPIGAYLAKRFMSPVHCSPRDSVQVFQDIKTKKALGVHWGTFILSEEGITDPPKVLKEECTKAGLEDDAFTTCQIGETVFF